MSATEERIATLRSVCADVTLKVEAGQEYVSLPGLKVRVDEETKVLDALLGLHPGASYPTRLYLSEAIANRSRIKGQPANWSVHSILGRTWHTWSWRDVPASLPLIQILLAHVKALA